MRPQPAPSFFQFQAYTKWLCDNGSPGNSVKYFDAILNKLTESQRINIVGFCWGAMFAVEFGNYKNAISRIASISSPHPSIQAIDSCGGSAVDESKKISVPTLLLVEDLKSKLGEK